VSLLQPRLTSFFCDRRIHTTQVLSAKTQLNHSDWKKAAGRSPEVVRPDGSIAISGSAVITRKTLLSAMPHFDCFARL